MKRVQLCKVLPANLQLDLNLNLNLKSKLRLVLALTLLIFSQTSYSKTLVNITDNTAAAHTAQSSNIQAVKTFYLNIWAPDQPAPIDAKPVEYGASYQYLYSPESHEIDPESNTQVLAFKFHPDLADRYQFRWIASDHPQLVSLNKMKKNKIKVTIERESNGADVYFEVWVFDTLTGEVLMCDPIIISRRAKL